VKIVVTGGSGMVGKSLRRILPDATYLSSKDYDLTSEKEVVRMFNDNKPDCVVHLAALVGGIVDNINRPGEYFTHNVLMNTLLIDYAYKMDIKRFIGTLSTCIYPDINNGYPLKEDDLHNGPPTNTNFSYGYAKRSMAVQIDAYNKQFGLSFQYLTPCNLYSENDKFGSNSHFVGALIKKIYNAKKNGENKIVLFGTGEPLRQFMHADDMAFVIKHCIDYGIYENMNVSVEENLSIRQMAEIALVACGAQHLTIEFDSTKPDGQFRKDVSIERLKKNIPSFKPIPLEAGIMNTYNKLIEKGTFEKCL
jgi:GDP-L-fucose synthase